jgi:excinuclease ABC subunit A
MEEKLIKVTNAKEHNLKNVSIDIPKNQLVVVTGLSGSGKSSLVFDTIYSEAQRRYIESLSVYARQFLNMQSKPDVESISGLSPAIAISQKTTSRNPRSTVATVTEIYDYMRLLFAKIGIPHSPETGLPISNQSSSQMVEQIKELPNGTKLYILAPIARGQKGEFRREIINVKKQGFARIKINGKIYKLNEPIPKLEKTKKHDIEVVVDRIVMSQNLGNRIADSVETALKLSDGIIFVEIVAVPEDYNKYKKKDIITFSEKFSCPESGFTIAEIEPRLFSFNSHYGACEACDGLGTEFFFSEELVVPDENLSLQEGAISVWQGSEAKHFGQILSALGEKYDFALDTPFKDLNEEARKIIFYGIEGEIEMKYQDGFRTYNVKHEFEGVINYLKFQYNDSSNSSLKENFAKYQDLTTCHVCNGTRLNEEALSVKVNGLNIAQLSAFSVVKAIEWLEKLQDNLDETEVKISYRIIKEINKRLGFLKNVGLEYLTLNRKAGTLSGGEAQRIRLASQIGSGLSGVIYVLDEPSIGLHQSDNNKLISTLKNLRDIGNSVLVVEHDEDMMRESDYLIDVGPGAGIHGGQIISKGTAEEVINDDNSITGQYLSGKKEISVPKERRIVSQKHMITIHDCVANNLKNITAKFPLGVFCSVSGISGGGKSSLVIHTLYKALHRLVNNAKSIAGPYKSIEGFAHIDKIIQIDQSSIGRTPRSNPCTYINAFTPIREFFTNLPEARARGYKSGRFSFNVKGGRCENCQGDGLIKIEMHFLPDIYVTCDVCKGHRYNKETLEIKYKDKTIADILEMTAEEAKDFFKNMPHIHEKFKALCDVGLNYIKIGQSATTLSGGEAQRIKLAKELSKKATGKTLYILDEPTTGLHFEDINKLLRSLHKLVDNGNSIIVIEHNLDIIKTSDWVIDIGPCGGEKGGYIVAEGTPEDVASNPNSVTGKFLKKMLKNE